MSLNLMVSGSSVLVMTNWATPCVLVVGAADISILSIDVIGNVCGVGVGLGGGDSRSVMLSGGAWYMIPGMVGSSI